MTRDSAQRSSCLVQLQHGTRTPPLFFVHGIGGSALIYRDLARAIDPDRRAYGFTSRGLDSDEPDPTSIEEMASHYLELLRAVQPDGPYLLVGASFGGTVAYEMARQLTARGCVVPLCALLDAPGPGRLPRLDLDTADRLALAFEDRGGPSAGQLRALPVDDQIRRALDAAAAAGVALAFSDLVQGRRVLAVWQSNARALASYAAPAWPDGEVQFFAPAEPHPQTPAEMERAWIGRCVVRLDVVPGDHMTMAVPPHAAALGARIRRFLDTCAGSTHA
jgi:thioesterase domain-containing protein